MDWHRLPVSLMSFINGPEQGPFSDDLECLVDEQFGGGTLDESERT